MTRTYNKSDDNKKRTGKDGVTRTNKTYSSVLEANAKSEANNYDLIRVRVPKGWRDKINEYVSEQHANEVDIAPEDQKYSSLNRMILRLLEAEMGEDIL